MVSLATVLGAGSPWAPPFLPEDCDVEGAIFTPLDDCRRNDTYYNYVHQYSHAYIIYMSRTFLLK